MFMFIEYILVPRNTQDLNQPHSNKLGVSLCATLSSCSHKRTATDPVAVLHEFFMLWQQQRFILQRAGSLLGQQQGQGMNKSKKIHLCARQMPIAIY